MRNIKYHIWHRHWIIFRYIWNLSNFYEQTCKRQRNIARLRQNSNLVFHTAYWKARLLWLYWIKLLVISMTQNRNGLNGACQAGNLKLFVILQPLFKSMPPSPHYFNRTTPYTVISGNFWFYWRAYRFNLLCKITF